ncbi:uncharacterized protein LOC134149689 [Rhea pennata]|uniref:uncharacterized protein LOC134149689 n=1 Tax=Rhea pennata TaxID=8795 RepID=UPI002E25C6E7
MGSFPHILAGPEWVFAAWRDPKGERAQELEHLAPKHPNLVIIPLAQPLTWHAVRTTATHSAPGNIASPCLQLLELGDPRQAFLPLLKKAAQGSSSSELSCSKAAIINMSSIVGSIEKMCLWNNVQYISYRCSKAALNMLTKCQSLGYWQHSILCAALHPGWVQMDMGNSAGHKIGCFLGQPPLMVDVSVQGMLNVLCSLSEKDTGTFLDWEGKALPW